jgi:HD-GYP domain-containing protein (c-di-GMP phosphodiesterase class II)
MKFIVMDKLKKGMRLARPVYNKDGVMLYDINTKLNKQGVNSIKNFDLLGVYILEPTEPVPELTEEDREFERFQTMTQFTLRSQLKIIIEQKESSEIQKLADAILKKYGNVNHKITFYKTLRSPEDYVYKHSLSVAILSTLMSLQLNMSYMEQLNIVTAALIHEIGTTMVPENILKKGANVTDEDSLTIRRCEEQGINIIQKDFDIPSLTRIMMSQNYKEVKGTNSPDAKLLE